MKVSASNVSADNVSGSNVSADNVSEPHESISPDDKGWSMENENQLFGSIQKLKYNRIITNFYLYETKRYESKWSWIIILISTITSGITVLNNVDEEDLPDPHFKTGINISLTVFSMITSLIASWIKKSQYVKKINESDRYCTKINKLCEELDFLLVLPRKDRSEYKSFTEKYFPLISEYLSSIPSISPSEWKKCLTDITNNYPEMLEYDGSDDAKLWPWFSLLSDTQLKDASEKYGDTRPRTKFFTDMIEENNRNCCSSKKNINSLP